MELRRGVTPSWTSTKWKSPKETSHATGSYLRRVWRSTSGA